MSLLYKEAKDLKYRVEITVKEEVVNFSFAVDGGKNGTWEQYDEYELTVGELLDVLRNNDECGFEYKTDEA
jgi:hypothetical protein